MDGEAYIEAGNRTPEEFLVTAGWQPVWRIRVPWCDTAFAGQRIRSARIYVC